MKKIFLFCILLTIQSFSGWSQVVQFPQIYYSAQGASGQIIRATPSLTGNVISSMISKIGAESISSITLSPYGVQNWIKVCLPGTSTSGNITYGYLLCNEFYARINEVNNYATVTATNLNIRSGPGTGFGNITISGINSTFGNNAIVALTGNTNSGWYEVYLPTNCSQSTGWLSGSFLIINSNTTNYRNVGGRICSNASNCAFLGDLGGAQVTLGTFGSTNSSGEGGGNAGGFYEYKLPVNASAIITCAHPNYNSSSPSSYSYTASAHNYTRNFVLSNSCSTPSSPTGLVVMSTSSTSVNLSWSPASGSSITYEVLKNITSCVSSFGSSGFTTTNTNGTVTGLSPNTTYYLVVTATNACGTSPNSNCVIAVTTTGASCTSPSASVNNPNGATSATMVCTASGGSGGGYSYKWYSGTSCTGTVSGTNSTLNVTTSGSYSCKVYITGFESTCFNCANGTATISPTTYSISGTVINPDISDLTGVIQTNPATCNVRIYLAGTTTQVGSTTSTGGSFNFTGLQNQSYDVVASYTSGGTTYSVKGLNVPSNSSNLQLKLSGNLIESIQGYNTSLSNQFCFLQDLGYSIPVKPYPVSTSTSYINTQHQIANNQGNTIESLERLCMAERLTKKYFQQAATMNNEYVLSVGEFGEFVFNMIKLADCNIFADVIVSAYLGWFKWAIEIPIDNMNSPYKNSLRIALDAVTDYIEIKATSSGGISLSLIYNTLRDPIDRILTDGNLDKIYINNTLDQVRNSATSAQNGLYSGNIQSTVSNLVTQLNNSEFQTAIAQSKAESYREQPGWVQLLTDFSNLALSATCGRNVYVNFLAIGLDLIKLGFLSASIYQSIHRGHQLVAESNQTVQNSFSRSINTNWNLFNMPVQSHRLAATAAIVSQFEAEYLNTLADINSNNTATFNAHMRNLDSLNKNLNDSLREEITRIKAAIPFSTISDSMYVTYLQHTLFSAPFVRFANLAAIASYFDVADTVIRDTLNYYSSNLITADSLMLAELAQIEAFLTSVATPAFIAVSESNIPLTMYPGSDSTVTIKVNNYGSTTASNVYAKISFDGLVTASSDSVFIGNLGVDQSASFSFIIQAPNNNDTVSFYEIRLFADSAMTSPLGGAIATSTVLSTQTYLFTGDGNWSNPDNWYRSILPPADLPEGAEIIISPFDNGECILNVPRRILPGRNFTIRPGKKFRILGDLEIQPSVPLVTTIPLTDIMPVSATAGGNITSDGGSQVTTRGICWSTSPNPTIADNVAASGTGNGDFTSSITSLTQNTTYFFRAFATNDAGTGYGNTVLLTTPIPSVSDIDGNQYPIITICSQEWTGKNLEVTHYRNGDTIPQIQDSTAWSTLTTGAWCYYQNNTANGPVYGKLYNWYAINDSRGLAPLGWHISTDADWTVLVDSCLGGSFVAGGKIKTTGTLAASTGLWNGTINTSTNSSGFSGVPAGYRLPTGAFSLLGDAAFWWTSTSSTSANAKFREADMGTDELVSGSYNKKLGIAVRCVKD